MTWQLQYTRTFLKDLAQLPESVRKRVENVAFGEEIKHDPFLDGRVQRLKGYPSHYKIRIGDY